MCILFSYLSKHLKKSEFKLIILNNRDEFFNRPSKPACFINKNNIYGTDLTPQKEGGTWLGLSKTGKIGCLLNLDKKDYSIDDINKEGRGFIVPNYLNSKLNFIKYAEVIKSEADKYNQFNLVLYEKTNDHWNVGILENHTFNFDIKNSEFVSISNHLYDRPYKKTVVGENLFKSIVQTCNNVNNRKILVEKLFALAKYDAGQNFDNLTNKQDTEEIRKMMQDQICIQIPHYGTRLI